jgi:2-amino-4-hydroxy-6-hydroxymethyldihydropteridine diphosphokinase
MTTSLISLGGNLGDVAATIESALQRLRQTPGISVVAGSSMHRTPPVGANAGTEFVNAAAVLETTLTAHELLDRLLTIETELGRVRTIHWGPRTLDLDLICFGDTVINDPPRLQVPHPACWYRRFVLDPLTEIAPQFVHPEKGICIAELQRRLLPRPLHVSLIGDTAELTTLIASVQPEFPAADLRCCTPDDVLAKSEGFVIQFATTKPNWPDVSTLLSRHLGWLDTSNHRRDQRQTLIDILRSVGL